VPPGSGSVGHDPVVAATGAGTPGAGTVAGQHLRGDPAVQVSDRAALDRLDALHTAVKAVRRGGTVSVSGVYGGEVDPMPLMEMFDRGVQLRMGQARVRRRIDDLPPIVSDDRDPLGVREFACIKVVLQP
jgi:threonine dehydrogenase-like Zn-dependent dehydrogenase